MSLPYLPPSLSIKDLGLLEVNSSSTVVVVKAVVIDTVRVVVAAALNAHYELDRTLCTLFALLHLVFTNGYEKKTLFLSSSIGKETEII